MRVMSDAALADLARVARREGYRDGEQATRRDNAAERERLERFEYDHEALLAEGIAEATARHAKEVDAAYRAGFADGFKSGQRSPRRRPRNG